MGNSPCRSDTSVHYSTFSYAIGYSEPGDSDYYYEYHNVLVGYADSGGLSWAAGEIADDLDVELTLWW